MNTLAYVQGAAIPNARKYELLKDDEHVAFQTFDQPMSIYGGISENGSPIETLTEANEGVGYALAPITKLTENGNIYYIRVAGEFDATTADYATARVPFSGIVALNSCESVNIQYNNDANTSPMRYENGIFYFKIKIQPPTGNAYNKEVEVFKVEGVSVLSCSLVEGSVKFYSADKSCVRTSFIPISALTGHTDGSCAGPFGFYDADPCPCKMTFYSGLSHSKRVATFQRIDIKNDLAVGGYLKIEAIQRYAEQYPTAKYVIFSSYKPSGEDENTVRVGGIYFPLFEMTDKFTPGVTYNLSVKAIADNKFFADSLPSIKKEYTPPVLS